MIMTSTLLVVSFRFSMILEVAGRDCAAETLCQDEEHCPGQPLSSVMLYNWLRKFITLGFGSYRCYSLFFDNFHLMQFCVLYTGGRLWFLQSFLRITHTHVSTRVMGTFGYLAPEYAASGKLTDRSDVYSFGVVLLELVTGRKPIDTRQPHRRGESGGMGNADYSPCT